MSQSQVQQFTIDESGKQYVLGNAIKNGTSIEFDYAILAGKTTTLSVSVMGLNSTTGQQDVLDTYTGNIGTARVISLSQTYDSFMVIATFTETGLQVGVTVKSSGAGAVFQGASVQVMSGIGSPAGVVAAPVGSVYVNLSGGSGTTLYVKESGGSTTAGWIGK